MFNQQEGRSAGSGSDLNDVVCFAVDNIQIAEIKSQNQTRFSETRLKYLAARLHKLGPKPLFYFLRELERGADLWQLLKIYADLPVDLIRAYGGDQFAPALYCIDGGQS